jgi:hypothetical protein
LPSYEQFSVVDTARLLQCLQPCDIILVEGNTRISKAVKFLTQSTWSHACIYLGGDDRCLLVEADLLGGVIKVPLSKYTDFNIRICRASSLSDEDKKQIIAFVNARIGYQYDLKNIIDLIRYLIPQPPVPGQYRRHLIALGSGDPTKAICSTLIAQAFQHVKYPILPREVDVCVGETCSVTDSRILESRHFSHFTPRDFDLSPYFSVVKPTLEQGFDHRKIRWLQDEEQALL